jgi:RHS repeat-associated protein
VLVDDVGELAWKAQLDVYGVARVEVAKTSCPWRRPGQYEDEETGLYYNRFRYYDPETGRYISQDPIGPTGGLNLYGYTQDPLYWIDPLGLARDIALGLTRDPLGNRLLSPFAEGVGAIGNQSWITSGLATEGPFVQRFYQALYRSTSEGGRIKFNLDYLKLGEALGAKRFSDPFAVGVTNWELQQVLHNDSFHGATDFYIGGQRLTPDEVSEFGLGRRVKKGCK